LKFLHIKDKADFYPKKVEKPVELSWVIYPCIDKTSKGDLRIALLSKRKFGVKR
jgi:hypothetical protein